MKLRCGWWRGSTKRWFFTYEVETDRDIIFKHDLPEALTELRQLLTTVNHEEEKEK